MGLFRKKPFERFKKEISKLEKKPPISPMQVDKVVDNYLGGFRTSMRALKDNREARKFIKKELNTLAGRYDKANTPEEKAALFKIIRALQQYASSNEPLTYV